MEISSHYTGSRIREFCMDVTARQAMNYAAGLGDANPHYLDDERPGGIVAPPLFAAAVTWQISRRMWEFLDAPGFPMQALMTQVHYSEHLIFHRCVRPGDKLTVTGRIAAMLPHRAGTHVVMEFLAADKAGAPVFTEFAGVMLRGVACADAGCGAENLPAPPDAGDDAVDAWSESVPIGALAAHVYDACADIHFPIHTSPRFARSVGLPGIILQGTATLAHAARCIVDREAGGDPGRLREISCRFGGMVAPGTDITVQGRARGGEAGRDVFFQALNAQGQGAVKRGYARIA